MLANYLLYRSVQYNDYSFSYLFRPKFPSSSSEVDDDVQAEKYRVANMTPDEIKDHVLVMARLTKFYRRFLAVNNLSVAVEQ